MPRTTSIKVDYLARVEGEAALLVKLEGERVRDIRLKIFEPPRFFEALLRGRHFTEVPDITSRVCGICPVAYQMTSVQAIEKGLGIEIDPMVRSLRRLLYCGEWLESHALHVFMLNAPDFLGLNDVVEMAATNQSLVEDALRLKKAGNRIMSVIGGREIHPVSAAVAGFHRMPARRELNALVEELKWALESAVNKVAWISSFEFPDFEQDYEFVALSHPREYAINEGRLISNKGLNIDVCHYEDCFAEEQVAHSNALHSKINGRGSYLVGPLARFNLNFEQLTPIARQTALDHGLRPPCLNPFRSILARAIEIVFAIEEALHLIESYEPPAAPRSEYAAQEGAGCAITEAPRGVIYNRYSFDEYGLITSARIVPPTSQNQKRIEDDLAGYVPRIAMLPPDDMRIRCERAVRSYDPCISCATHFLKLQVERD